MIAGRSIEGSGRRRDRDGDRTSEEILGFYWTTLQESEDYANDRRLRYNKTGKTTADHSASLRDGHAGTLEATSPSNRWRKTKLVSHFVCIQEESRYSLASSTIPSMK